MLIARHTEYLKNLIDNPITKELIDKALSTYPMYEPQNETMYSIIPTREQLNNKPMDNKTIKYFLKSQHSIKG